MTASFKSQKNEKASPAAGQNHPAFGAERQHVAHQHLQVGTTPHKAECQNTGKQAINQSRFYFDDVSSCKNSVIDPKMKTKPADASVILLGHSPRR